MKSSLLAPLAFLALLLSSLATLSSSRTSIASPLQAAVAGIFQSSSTSEQSGQALAVLALEDGSGATQTLTAPKKVSKLRLDNERILAELEDLKKKQTDIPTESDLETAAEAYKKKLAADLESKLKTLVDALPKPAGLSAEDRRLLTVAATVDAKASGASAKADSASAKADSAMSVANASSRAAGLGMSGILPLSGGTLTGDLALSSDKNLTVGGNISGTAGTFSGAFSGATASFSGLVQMSGKSSTTLASVLDVFYVGRTATTTIRGDGIASVLPYASTTMVTATTASTTNFTVSAMNIGSVFFAGAGGAITQDNSNLFWDDTNNLLGLGTTSPYAKLSVVGQAVAAYFTATTSTASTFPYASTTALTSAGSAYFATSGGSVGIGTTSPWGQFSVNSNGITGPSFVVGSSTATNFIVTNVGRVGIGVANPNFAVEIAAATDHLGFSDASGNDKWVQYLAGDDMRLWDTQDRVTFASGGNVGIGTTSPYAKLSVVGQAVAAYFTATTSTASTFPYASTTALTVSGTASTTNLTVSAMTAGSVLFTGPAGALTQDNASLFFDNTNNRLGIGTTTPDMPLQVAATNNGGILFTDPAAGADQKHFYISSDRGTLSFGRRTDTLVTNNDYLSLASDGTFGVATDTPWRKLSVAGTVGFSSTLTSATTGNYLCINTSSYEVTSGTTCSASSERFKDNIRDLSYGLADVLRLRPVSFTYKKEVDPVNFDKTRLGFVAEEVRMILPELVELDSEGRPESVDYAKAVAVLVKAIQEQEQSLQAIRAQLGSSSMRLDSGGSLVVTTLQVASAPEIGSSEVPAGITLYDQITREPRCLVVANNYPVVTNGRCAVGSETSHSTDIALTPPTVTTSSDTVAPVISINGNNPATLQVGDSYIDLGATITDNVDHNLGLLVAGDAVDTRTPGNYVIHYNARDNAGNQAIEVLRTVVVEAPASTEQSPVPTAE